MRKTILAALAACSVLFFPLFGCSSDGNADMEAVVSDFIAAINERDIEAVRACLDAKAGDYAEDLDFWTDDERFGSAADRVLADFEELTGTTARAVFSSETDGGKTFYFKMTDGGSRFYIRRIDKSATLASPIFQ